MFINLTYKDQHEDEQIEEAKSEEDPIEEHPEPNFDF